MTGTAARKKNGMGGQRFARRRRSRAKNAACAFASSRSTALRLTFSIRWKTPLAWCEEVGSPNVKIHFDTFHSNIEEKHQAEALRAVAKQVGHVHISENDRGIPGTGHVDWKGVFKVLKETGYDGWLTIESFAQPEPALAAAAAIWRDPAPSGDVLGA